MTKNHKYTAVFFFISLILSNIVQCQPSLRDPTQILVLQLSPSNDQKVSLTNFLNNYLKDGIYKLAPNSVQFEINGPTMYFKKCNTHKFSVNYDSQSLNIQFKYLSGTTKSCPDDFDKYYINHFEKITSYQVSLDNKISQFQINGQKASNVYGRPSGNGIGIDGVWSLYFDNPEIEVVKDTLILRGCKTVLLDYETKSGGFIKIRFSKQGSKVCNIDNDNILIGILQSARKYSIDNGGFVLTNSENLVATKAYYT